MTDRAAPKPKKPAKGKPEAKVPGPKLVDKDAKPGVGHNSTNTGESHPEVMKCLIELLSYQEKKKSLAKAERDVRNRLKSEFNILASSVTRELSLRKLATDVRVQVETNHEDFKKMLGYQASLDFAGDKPTDASLKAQPSEAKMAERNTEPTRKPVAVIDIDAAQPPDGPSPIAKGFAVDYSDPSEAADNGGVIEREG